MKMFRIAVKFIVPAIATFTLIVVYSGRTVVVTDDEWDVCVTTGHCEFGIDRFVTPEEKENAQ